MKHGVLLWCLDEMDALPVVCDQLYSSIKQTDKDITVLFVDGNSQDGSREYLQSRGFWVHSQINRGMRNAINEGVDLLLDLKVDSITFAQPDGNCDLSKILSIIEPFTNQSEQLIIAARYKPPAQSFDDNFVSQIGNWYFTRIISFVSGYNFYDAMVGYRTFSSSLVKKLGLIEEKSFWFPEKLFSTSLGWDPILSCLAPLYDVEVIEIGISEPKRIGGKVKKQTIRWGIGYTLQVIYIYYKKVIQKNF